MLNARMNNTDTDTQSPTGFRIRWSRVFSVETLLMGMIVAMFAGLFTDWVGDAETTQAQASRNAERLSTVEANMETLTNDVSSLKETQAKQSEILTQIRARQAAMEVSQAAMQATQAEIKATQTEIKASQAAMQSTQAEIKATQAEIKVSQAAMQSTQTEIKATQAEQGETLSDLKVAIARIEALLLEGR